MKTVVLLLGLAGLGATPAIAQTTTVAAPLLPTDSVTHRIKFLGVVTLPGVSAAELQARARQWLALTFEDAHQVTQLDDEARGVLIGRGYTNLWLKTKPDGTGGTRQLLGFTLRLDFRDGRYRYEVRDLSLPIFPQAASGSITEVVVAQTIGGQARERPGS